eukprot:CCRYP_008943-RA/>CCRYP_008943-RA protein AED:0.54 eAED:0.47 QI:0/0/0/0.6/0/0/5/0/256
MEWFVCSLPLCPPGGLDSKDFDGMEDMFFIQAEDELFGKDWSSCYATNILDAKYEWTDYKKEGCGYGLLPEREVIGQKVEFNALTWIDTASNLVEIIRIDNKTAPHIHDKFTQCSLCRYPRPMCCVHNKGGEFIGSSFQWLLKLFNIKDVCSTSKNPQSNPVCERMHQTVGNVLRTLVHTNPPQNMTQVRDIIKNALATAMHTMCTTVATTLGSCKPPTLRELWCGHAAAKEMSPQPSREHLELIHYEYTPPAMME